MDLIYRSQLGLTGNQLEIQTKLSSIDTKFKKILAYLNKGGTDMPTNTKLQKEFLKPPKEQKAQTEKKLVKSNSIQGNSPMD